MTKTGNQEAYIQVFRKFEVLRLMETVSCYRLRRDLSKGGLFVFAMAIYVSPGLNSPSSFTRNAEIQGVFYEPIPVPM